MAGKKKYRCNINPEKQWGGKRENSGFPAKWKSGNSKPLRIPENLHEAVLAYAHALDDGQQPEAASSDLQSIMLPVNGSETASAEEIRQMRLTLEAMRSTLGQWREELKHHNLQSPRWKKASDLLEALERHLHTRWL